jgi:bacteriorhodopsin
MTESILFVLSIGMVIFGLSTAYFAWVGRKKLLNSAFLVSAVTLVSYLVMISGEYVVFVSNGISGAPEPVFWTRWIAYAFSCSILMYVIATRAKVENHTRTMIIILNILVMVTGAFASVSDGWLLWMFFGVSSAFYLGMIGLLYKNGHSQGLKKIGPYILFGWSIFPVVFLLAPEGFGFICATSAVVGYLVLDILTKIIFYLDLEHGGIEAERFES